MHKIGDWLRDMRGLPRELVAKVTISPISKVVERLRHGAVAASQSGTRDGRNLQIWVYLVCVVQRHPCDGDAIPDRNGARLLLDWSRKTIEAA